MGAALRESRSHRQHWLRAVQVLYLALLSDAQGHRHQRRIQVPPPDIARPLDKQRIAGEFECLLPMRLQTDCTPDSRHRGLRQARFARHGACAPVRRARWNAVQRPGNHGINASVVNRAWCTRARRTEQFVEPLLDESRALLRDRLLRDSMAARDDLVVNSLGSSPPMRFDLLDGHRLGHRGTAGQ